MKHLGALFLWGAFSVYVNAQPVILGTAGNFGVLAGSAVTNTGPTAIIGNLGVSPGTAVSGFPPGTVSGGTHIGSDPVAIQAQTDLTTAYLDAQGRPPGTVVAGDIGGTTRTPGTYTSSSTLGITGNLTLNGAGVYIFQIASGLTTASGSQVILTGGATADNVFWQVGSSATLGTGSIFNGNILAQASITVTTSAVLNGRALARTGAVTLDSNALTNPTGSGAPTPGRDTRSVFSNSRGDRANLRRALLGAKTVTPALEKHLTAGAAVWHRVCERNSSGPAPEQSPASQRWQRMDESAMGELCEVTRTRGGKAIQPRTQHERMRRAIVVLTAVALVACYAPTLRGMVEQWSSDEDMSHGFVVPIVALWIVWRERARWQSLPAEPSRWGFVVLAAGAGMQFIAELGAGLFAGSVAFLVSVAGSVLSLGGFAWLRALALPLLLALFMLPKLAVVYNQVTLPLQLLASRIAAGTLTAVGIGVIREGNILDVAGNRVSVVEACNGIRYLLSLGLMAVVFAYLSDTKPWMRIVLLAAAVPIAILANALRVAAAGWLPALDAGTPHAISGGVLFLFCLATLVVVQRLFNKVYARYQS